MWLLSLLQPFLFLLFSASVSCGGAKSESSTPGDKDGSSSQKESSVASKGEKSSVNKKSKKPSSKTDSKIEDENEEGDEKEEGEEKKKKKLTPEEQKKMAMKLSNSMIIDDLVSMATTEKLDSFSMVYADKFDRVTSRFQPRLASADCTNLLDSCQEAKLRHHEMRESMFQPSFHLGEIVNRRKHKQFYKQKGLPQHPKEKEAPYTKKEREALRDRLEEKYMGKHATFDERAEAHVVYGFDIIRGDGQYDENTMDDMTFTTREQLERNIDQVVAGNK